MIYRVQIRHVRQHSPQNAVVVLGLPCFFMLGVPIAKWTVLFVSDPVGVLFLVLRSCIVPAFALRAREYDIVSH